MNFDKIAYLFDSTMLGDKQNQSVTVVQSYVHNPLYIQDYAKEFFEKYQIPTNVDEIFNEWIETDENSETLVNSLMKLYDDFGNLGVSSIFIERDYTLFLYLIGVMIPSSEISDPGFRSHLDDLYSDFQRFESNGILKDSVIETVTGFNDAMAYLLKNHKEHQLIKNIFFEKSRKIEDQISLLQHIEKEGYGPFMAIDYFFYIKQLLDVYKQNGVKHVLTTSNFANRFEEVMKRFNKNTDYDIEINSEFRKEEDKIVYDFERFIMTLSNFFIQKVLSITNVEVIEEDDKYLLAILWLIFQSSDNNYMFINSHSYEMMQNVIISLKKEMKM